MGNGPGRSFFFAGGGTGGHIYPAVAVAEKLVRLDPTARLHFFVSGRDIDRKILDKTGFAYSVLPAVGFSIRPGGFVRFLKGLIGSYSIAAEVIGRAERAVVVGVGGYVAVPVCWAGHRLKVPVALLNVDIVPGRANKLIARWAGRIFVQFEETAGDFGKYRAGVRVAGCPLRSGFEVPDPDRARTQLGLDKGKKTLLITGASSGSQNINRTICSLLPQLEPFADGWQIVHLAGRANFEQVKAEYAGAQIAHKIVAYYDDMADLLAAADLVVGRSGAVSVAEYASAAVASICMPYPYHRDMHQYFNAGKLVEAGASIIVDDVPDETDRREWLWEELEPLLSDEHKRAEMRQACGRIARKDASAAIAGELLGFG